MTVRSHFEDVNQLIFRSQIIKHKNETSKAKFATKACFFKMEIVEAGSMLLYMQKELTWSESDCETF